MDPGPSRDCGHRHDTHGDFTLTLRIVRIVPGRLWGLLLWISVAGMLVAGMSVIVIQCLQ